MIEYLELVAMGAIASGQLMVCISDKEAADEFSNCLTSSGLFDYGGPVDVSFAEDGLHIGFSSNGDGEQCWDWLDTQMSSETQLGQECRKLLIAADIYGHTYEYHGQHRDRVWKEPGESRLNRETANMPDNIIDVLKIAGAFLLEPEGEISTANGMIKLTKKSSPSEDSGFIDYTFLVAGYYSMTVTLRISEKSLASDAIEHSILEMCLEEWMPEEEEYNHSAVFKEIVDDIVADFDHIYTATEAPPVISFTEKPEPTEQEIADLEQMTCRRDFLGFHALINLDCELMNRISNANGNLEEVATIAKSLGYDATKGNWRRLQMLRMGTRTSKEMVEHWNVMLKRLSLAEIEDLTLH